MQRQRTVCWLVGATLVLSVLSTDVFAQRGGGRGPQTRTRYELATLPEVQGDLKLDDQQKALATELLAKQREKRQSFGQGGDFQAIRAEMTKLNADFDAQFMAALNESQQTRLNGLLAQVNGPVTLLDPAIAGRIGVTDEQMSKLNSVNETNRRDRREAGTSFQNMSEEGRRAAMAELTERQNKALLAVLSEEQRKQFEALKGEPLTIDQTPLRQGRGGPGGGQN